jgi:tetratricopeptide (TPR) repeat protein
MKQIARITLLLLFLSSLVPCLVFAETADQWNAKGLEYLAVGNLDKALECYNKAIKADPRYPYAYISRAWVYNLTGEFAKAIPDATKAIDLKPSYYLAEAYNNRAWALCGLGRFAEALPDCDMAIRLDPTIPYAFNNRGWALCGLGRYRDALDDLEKAIDMEPNEFLSFSYVNRGWAYYGLGEYDDALDDYEKACEMGNQFGCEAYRDLKAKIDELD